MRPGRHGASELHARPTQPEPRARLTSVLGAADVPVTAGFQAAARSVRFRPDVTTPPPRPAPRGPGSRQRVPPGFGGGRGGLQAAAGGGWRVGRSLQAPGDPLSPQAGRLPTGGDTGVRSDSGQGGFRVLGAGRGGGGGRGAGFRETPSARRCRGVALET